MLIENKYTNLANGSNECSELLLSSIFKSYGKLIFRACFWLGG